MKSEKIAIFQIKEIQMDRTCSMYGNKTAGGKPNEEKTAWGLGWMGGHNWFRTWSSQLLWQ
jgi:hypothetical protein